VRAEGVRSTPFGERKRASPEGTPHRVRTAERAPGRLEPREIERLRVRVSG